MIFTSDCMTTLSTVSADASGAARMPPSARSEARRTRRMTLAPRNMKAKVYVRKWLEGQLVDAACRARKQGRLFGRRRLGGQPLEGIPQHAEARGDLVDREIALEHAALGAEQLDAGLDPGLVGLGERLGARRRRLLVEFEEAQGHAEPAQLDVDVRPLGELRHRLLPVVERRLVVLV